MPHLPSRGTCDASNMDDCIDDPGTAQWRCGKLSTHTTCDPIGGTVCAEHKCRCSKPLAPALAQAICEDEATLAKIAEHARAAFVDDPAMDMHAAHAALRAILKLAEGK